MFWCQEHDQQGCQKPLVTSLDDSTTHQLPPVIECDAVLDNRNEIATPDIAKRFPHLANIASHIPELDPEAKILLLIGRDLIIAHHVLDQRISHDAPYAQKLSLGWTIIGETCLNKAHLPATISVNKVYPHNDGRPSILLPCNSSLTVKLLLLTKMICLPYLKEHQMIISQGLHRKIIYS